MRNFEANYDELTEVEQDLRYLRLCTMQTKERTTMSARHAQERVLLALQIQKEVRQQGEG